MAQTNQYGLRQWEAYEGLRRGDLNQAMEGVDQALAGAIAGVNQSVTAAAAQASQALAAEITARTNADAGLQGQLTSLDTAKPELVSGTYLGDGTKTRDIHLGFAPKAVYLEESAGERIATGAIYGGLALPGAPLRYPDVTPAMELTQTGFRVGYCDPPKGSYTNLLKTSYYYMAVK